MFDRVHNYKQQNEQVYKVECQPYISKVVEGYNCTIFAYGQSQTGKTYTL